VNQKIFLRTALVQGEIDTHLLPDGLAAKGLLVEVEDLVACALRWFGIPPIFFWNRVMSSSRRFFPSLVDFTGLPS